MYKANENRYNKMAYKRCGNSGLDLPLISLGLWHNFGHVDDFENAKEILKHAFNNGITHFDLANNYGPPYGSAEENFGKVLTSDFKLYRDEMIISTKAGYDMWPGPYGNWGSKKYLTASLNQSLKRMKLDYVDIFYHHRPDLKTPLEETMHTLNLIVEQGKALYVGISNYPPELTLKASEILKELGTPFIIHQARYSMLDRWVEDGLLDLLQKEGLGLIAFSPLAQGQLSNKYINGIPKNSRANKSWGHLQEKMVLQNLPKIKALHSIAQNRNQTLAQMAISWLLKDDRVTSVLIGASSVKQLNDNLKATESLHFSIQELIEIKTILNE